MSQTVPYRKNDPEVPAWFDPKFSFGESSYRVKMEIGMIPVLASIPCGKCAKSTREMLKNLGVTISTDDQKVDVLDHVSNLPCERSHSTPDPEHVSFIKNVLIHEIEDICSMSEVPLSNPLFNKITLHVEKILLSLIICNECSSNEDYFADLLKT